MTKTLTFERMHIGASRFRAFLLEPTSLMQVQTIITMLTVGEILALKITKLNNNMGAAM